MAFCAIKIAEIGTPTHKNGAVSDENGRLIEEAFDHGLNHKVTATTIKIARRQKGEQEFTSVFYDSAVEVDFYVTDCRLAYTCLKYDKGARWSGGLTAAALNAIEKAKANKRSAGKMLIGHIRYEWVKEVLYICHKKEKMFDSDDYHLLVMYTDNDSSLWYVDLAFAKGTDTFFLANEIVHNVCRYRAAMKDEKEDKETSFFSEYLTKDVPESNNSKEYKGIRVPTAYIAPGFYPDLLPDW